MAKKAVQIISFAMKAFVIMPKSIKDQIPVLQALEAAHASGDYSELLKSAKIEGVKAELVRRQFDEAELKALTEPKLTEGESDQGTVAGEVTGDQDGGEAEATEASTPIPVGAEDEQPPVSTRKRARA